MADVSNREDPTLCVKHGGKDPTILEIMCDACVKEWKAWAELALMPDDEFHKKFGDPPADE